MQRRRPTTGMLTTIGDLPVDLRAGVRRRFWQSTLATIAVAAAIAITARGTAPDASSPTSSSTASSRVDPMPASPNHVDALPGTNGIAAMNRIDPTPAASTRVDSSSTAPNGVDPVPAAQSRGPTRARGDARPPAVESLGDEPCDPPTCALHGNERECCAPFRATPPPEALDRAMVEAAIATVKASIVACAAGSTSEGTIRIAVDVGGNGRVAHTAIDEAPEAGVARCIAAAVRTARFTATQRGGTFAYRYELP